MDDGCASHICIPNYDAWVGNSGRGHSDKAQRVESEPGSPLTEDAERVSGNVAKDPAKKNDLHRFMEHYSEVTQTPLVNVDRAERYWKQLSTKERTKAFENIEDYYFNLSDIRYCMQAATYLRDLRESDVIEQDGNALLLIAKQRNGEGGEVYFRHNPSLTEIDDYVPTLEWMQQHVR